MSRTLLRSLREGTAIEDRDFDEVYPKWARSHSKIHWTPVEVAMRAAGFLAEDAGARVLDVGSGVGKFCLVGALTSHGVFTGVELRPQLAALSTEVARRYSVKRCEFIAGDAFDLDWSAFSGFYLYNPFAEHLPDCPVIDDEISRTPDRFHRYVAELERRMDAMPLGARIATYHGFGGRFPVGWTPITSMRLHGGSLGLWQKSML